MTVVLAADTFGDPFLLDDLTLPRPAIAYGIQKLDTDQLFDRQSGSFLSVREPRLAPRFDDFASAFAAAADWLSSNGIAVEEHSLSIVPLGYDPFLERHILILGVLGSHP